MNFKLFKQIAAENILLAEMKFISELNMEAFLIENPQLLTTDEYSDVKIILNQLTICKGRKSKNTDGRIDLLANINDEYISVIELKNGIIKSEHIEQLIDYLDEFNKNKIKLISELSDQYSIKGDQLLGIIVGTEIISDLKVKLSEGLYSNDILIIGMTVNRYKSLDNKEVYILSEIFAPLKSVFNRLRFDNWNEFEEFQKEEMKINDNAIKIAKLIHDKSLEVFEITPNEINYAKIAFTLNIPIEKSKNRRVFGFCKMYRTKVRVYMDYDKTIPEFGFQNPDIRFPKTFYIDIDIEKIDKVETVLFPYLKESYILLSL